MGWAFWISGGKWPGLYEFEVGCVLHVEIGEGEFDGWIVEVEAKEWGDVGESFWAIEWRDVGESVWVGEGDCELCAGEETCGLGAGEICWIGVGRVKLDVNQFDELCAVLFELTKLLTELEDVDMISL